MSTYAEQLKELTDLVGQAAVEKFAEKLILRLTEEQALWASEWDVLTVDGRENLPLIARARQARHSVEIATNLLVEYRQAALPTRDQLVADIDKREVETK